MKITYVDIFALVTNFSCEGGNSQSVQRLPCLVLGGVDGYFYRWFKQIPTVKYWQERENFWIYWGLSLKDQTVPVNFYPSLWTQTKSPTSSN